MLYGRRAVRWTYTIGRQGNRIHYFLLLCSGILDNDTCELQEHYLTERRLTDTEEGAGR